MNNDFKKAGYFSAVVIFIIGVLSLIVSTAANYFAYDDTVVMVGELISLLALMGLLIICVTSKSNYNRACVKFAEYILNNRKKEAKHKSVEAERIKEIQNMKSAAVQERENAVAAALEQGRSEGAQAVAAHMSQQRAVPMQPNNAPPSEAYQPVYPRYVPNITPSEEILYNEYGEPVMVRRRVRRQRLQGGDVLYDRYGTPVMRRVEPNAEVVSAPIPNPSANANANSVQAPATETKSASAHINSPIPNPVSIPKPVTNPFPTPVPTPPSLPKLADEPDPKPEPKPTPAAISTTNHYAASTAVPNEQSGGQPYQISWRSSSQAESSASDDDFDDDSGTPKPINLNPYKM